MSSSMWERIGEPLISFYNRAPSSSDGAFTLSSYSAVPHFYSSSSNMMPTSYMSLSPTEPVEQFLTSNTTWSQQSMYDVPSVWPNSISLEHLSSPEQLQLQHLYAFLQDKGRSSILLTLNGLFTCCICGKGYPDRRHASRHIKDEAERDRYRCIHCGKGEYRPENMKAHYSRHHRNQSHTCEQCQKFQYFAHDGQLACFCKFPHVCDVCGKSFPTKDALNRHKLTHRDGE